LAPEAETPHHDVGPHAFMLRLWIERREVGGAPPRVRGWVQHLASGAERHVSDVDQLVDFAADCLPDAADSVRRWGRS
jgi:hypothetical protein